MTKKATRSEQYSDLRGTLYLAFELGMKEWKLGFSIGLGQKARRLTIPGGDLDKLKREIAAAKKRFQLPETAPVVSCYEAGRDGFWIGPPRRAKELAPHSRPAPGKERGFEFILSMADYARVDKQRAVLLWPYSYSQSEVLKAQEFRPRIRCGKGRQVISNATVGHPDDPAAADIRQLSFHAELSLRR